MKPYVGSLTQSRARHKHNCYEIIYYRKGGGSFYISDEIIDIKPGRFIIVSPGIVHSSIYTTETEAIFIQAEFNHVFSFTYPVVVMDNDAKDGNFLTKMIFENRFSNSEYLVSLTNALAHFLLQNVQTEKNINVVLKDIITKISDNFYDAGINIAEFFKESGYAEDYIRAQFKLFTGKTPVEFLTELRINQACYLIDIYKDSLPLSEIAEKCGYTDYVYFSRRFKQMVGMSPKSYMNA